MIFCALTGTAPVNPTHIHEKTAYPHPAFSCISDVQKVMELLDSLVERGNTVIVIEHNLDVMKQADWLIDVGPDGGISGGEIVFAGTPADMAARADTITADYLRKSL